MSSNLAYTYLRKDKDYVYCFKREQVIEEEDCDYYEHNLECDKNNDFWGRTHRKRTLAGYSVQGVNGSFINDCRYCLKNESDYKKYYLPIDAKINKKGRIERIMEVFK